MRGNIIKKRLMSYSRYWTGTSLQWRRLMWGKTPCSSPSCKLVPVQSGSYNEYENGYSPTKEISWEIRESSEIPEILRIVEFPKYDLSNRALKGRMGRIFLIRNFPSFWGILRGCGQWNFFQQSERSYVRGFGSVLSILLYRKLTIVRLTPLTS